VRAAKEKRTNVVVKGVARPKGFVFEAPHQEDGNIHPAVVGRPTLKVIPLPMAVFFHLDVNHRRVDETAHHLSCAPIPTDEEAPLLEEDPQAVNTNAPPRVRNLQAAEQEVHLLEEIAQINQAMTTVPLSILEPLKNA
jgi:hypothetical protein